MRWGVRETGCGFDVIFFFSSFDEGWYCFFFYSLAGGGVAWLGLVGLRALWCEFLFRRVKRRGKIVNVFRIY